MIFRCPRGCEVQLGMSERNFAGQCEKHGEPLRYTKSLSRSPAPKQRKPLKRGRVKRSQPKRDWGDARAKVELEGRCRFCGSERRLEAAHIIGRKCDEPDEARPSVLYVKPDRIVPLCGEGAEPTLSGCHKLYDAHALDLLPFLSREEQVQAVKDAGSIESARVRLAPSAYREVAA